MLLSVPEPRHSRFDLIGSRSPRFLGWRAQDQQRMLVLIVKSKKETPVFARTSTWTGTPETLDKWDVGVAAVRQFVTGLEGNAGAFFLVDRAGGRALTLTLWNTEAAAVASDAFADQSRARTVAATGVELLERGQYEVVDGVEAG